MLQKLFGMKVVILLYIRRIKKCSLFPLTSPKKLGTVGRQNFFFLINFFFVSERKLPIFILQTCSYLLFLLSLVKKAS